jgi:hypothetical protein
MHKNFQDKKCNKYRIMTYRPHMPLSNTWYNGQSKSQANQIWSESPFIGKTAYTVQCTLHASQKRLQFGWLVPGLFLIHDRKILHSKSVCFSQFGRKFSRSALALCVKGTCNCTLYSKNLKGGVGEAEDGDWQEDGEHHTLRYLPGGGFYAALLRVSMHFLFLLCDHLPWCHYVITP